MQGCSSVRIIAHQSQIRGLHILRMPAQGVRLASQRDSGLRLRDPPQVEAERLLQLVQRLVRLVRLRLVPVLNRGGPSHILIGLYAAVSAGLAIQNSTGWYIEDGESII